MIMQETYHLYNKSLDIPYMDFIREKNKYKTVKRNKKRYLYKNIECYVSDNGHKECFRKELIRHREETDILVIDWLVTKIEWPQDLEWDECEELTDEIYKSDNEIKHFITTKKGIRRIVTIRKI